MTFVNPSEDSIRALLGGARTVAIVGFSRRPQRASHNIARQLQRLGLRIIPVRPGLDSGLGERAWPDLASLPEAPDIVNVFRAPEHVPGIVDECLARGFSTLWLQDGVIHEPAARRARDAGMFVVMDRCLMRDYARRDCARWLASRLNEFRDGKESRGDSE